jgi:hypothetical protein
MNANFNNFRKQTSQTNKKNGMIDLLIIVISNFVMFAITGNVIANYKSHGLLFLKISVAMPLLSVLYLFLRPQILDRSHSNKWGRFYINGLIASGVIIGLILFINSLHINILTFEALAKIIIGIIASVLGIAFLFALLSVFFSALFPFLRGVRERINFKNELFEMQKPFLLEENRQYYNESVRQTQYINETVNRHQKQAKPEKPVNEKTYERSYQHETETEPNPEEFRRQEPANVKIKRFLIEHSFDFLEVDKVPELAKQLKLSLDETNRAIRNSGSFTVFKLANGQQIFSYHSRSVLEEILEKEESYARV